MFLITNVIDCHHLHSTKVIIGHSYHDCCSWSVTCLIAGACDHRHLITNNWSPTLNPQYFIHASDQGRVWTLTATKCDRRCLQWLSWLTGNIPGHEYLLPSIFLISISIHKFLIFSVSGTNISDDHCISSFTIFVIAGASYHSRSWFPMCWSPMPPIINVLVHWEAWPSMSPINVFPIIDRSDHSYFSSVSPITLLSSPMFP